MFVSEVCKDLDLAFVQEGEFEAVGLIGLRKNESEKHIGYLLGEKYLEKAVEEGFECLIIPEEIVEQIKTSFDGGICVAANPKTALFEIHEKLNAGKTYPATVIAESAIISEKATIASTGVRIGENTIIEENVVIRENTIIGDNCHIMPGTVVGNPAYYFYGEGDNKKMVLSTGGVELGNNVCIHANVSICKGVIGGMTWLKDNVALDGSIFIGHDCIIGKNTNLAGGCTLAGWVEIGDDCFWGMNAMAAPMVKVADNVQVSIGAVITKDVVEAGRVSGNFAVPHEKFINNLKNIMD